MTELRFPLVCFDLDGTLVEDTVFIWKTLHESFQTDPAVRQKAHDDYFSGRISYNDWFDCDLELLHAAGATQEKIMEVVDTLSIMPGAIEALTTLKERGHKLAIVSGSLDVVVDRLFGQMEFDHILLNRLLFDGEGRISGGVATPYDLEGKADGLRELCRLEGIVPEQAAFVGDNFNDLWIARAAGYSIAFNCKSDQLRQVCDVEVVEPDLRRVVDAIPLNAGRG